MDGVAWTTALLNTSDLVPSTILTEENLFENFNKKLIPIMWDEAPESNIQGF